MAERGKPLPMATKAAIRHRHAAGEPLRRIAADLEINKTTAQKFGTKPLKAKRGLF